MSGMPAILPNLTIAAAARRSVQVGFVLVAFATAAHADPLSTYDDFMTSIPILRECHVEISVAPSEAKAAKMTAMGNAAWHELWAALDEKDASHHDENARTADFELKKRSEADLAQARELVASKGCAALVPQARDKLKDYFQ